MSLWEERAARNEALFREVNEQVEGRAAASPEASEAEFVCECSNDACVEHVRIPLATYETIRAEPRRFLLKPGHENESEHVVERSDDYVVVEKEGRAGQIADRTDPRS